MHHVPYKHTLHSGKSVIQHFYDAHYNGAEEAAHFVAQWKSLKGRVDDQRFREVLERLEFQAGHAQVWRDAICRWFLKRSGIADEQGRVGNYPGRLEAEDQQLTGYKQTSITPWEAASGRGIVQLPAVVSTGAINFRFDGRSGYYDLHLRYFDEQDGVSQFKLFVGERRLDAWKAHHELPTPTTLPDAHSSIMRTVKGVRLKDGDVIRLDGRGDAGERAAIDYLEIIPSGTNQPSQ
jgi:alpha-glucuronidase